MELKIREAAAADAGGIGYVHYNAWIETYTGLVSAEFLSTRSVSKSADIFKKSKCRDVVVATADGKIVGFCGYEKACDRDMPDTCGEIRGIYVLRQYQRRSLGERLLEHAKRKLSEQGYKTVCLWVLHSNENAICFYEKSGFHFDGTEKIETLATPVKEIRYLCTL